MAKIDKKAITVLTDDKRRQVIELLIRGESPLYIAKSLNLQQSSVLSVLGCRDFSHKCLELFRNQARGLALVALHNVTRIAFSPDSTPATQLKASKILVDIARELEEMNPDDLEPSTMTQSQLAERLKALQKEASTRARPINTGQIDQPSQPTLDDILS